VAATANVFQIDYFETFGTRVKRHCRVLKLSIDEASSVIQKLLKRLEEGKIRSFIVAPYVAFEDEVYGDEDLMLPEDEDELIADDEVPHSARKSVGTDFMVV
jgi:hypothetical protein